MRSLIGALLLALFLVGSKSAKAKDSLGKAEPKPDPDLPPVPPGELQGQSGESPAQVVARYLYGVPTQGGLYLVQGGDFWLQNVRQALGIPPGQSNDRTLPYARSMTADPYNFELFATPWDSQEPNVPAYMGVEKDGGLWVMSKAYLPRHKDLLASMRTGAPLVRNIGWTKTGPKLGPGGEYGLIYFPYEDGRPMPADLAAIIRYA